MKKSRRKFTSEFKTRVALEVIKERKTLSELASEFELYPNQISQWKQEFLEKSKDIFDIKTVKAEKEKEIDLDELYKKIGNLEMERDFFKKSLDKWEIIQRRGR